MKQLYTLVSRFEQDLIAKKASGKNMIANGWLLIHVSREKYTENN